MAPQSILDWATYWKYKTPADNQWHPIPGVGHTRIRELPSWMSRIDIEAAAVDVAPFIVGVGALTHVSQANAFGFTAHASVFKNPRTLLAMHNTATILAGLVIALQLSGTQYRQFIPRWASEREIRRNEQEVRQHVDVGMIAGTCIMLTRTILKKGPTPSMMDVILGGALGDVLLREYFRAHNL